MIPFQVNDIVKDKKTKDSIHLRVVTKVAANYFVVVYYDKNMMPFSGARFFNPGDFEVVGRFKPHTKECFYGVPLPKEKVLSDDEFVLRAELTEAKKQLAQADDVFAKRIQMLLEDNNRYLEEARQARRDLKTMTDTLRAVENDRNDLLADLARFSEVVNRFAASFAKKKHAAIEDKAGKDDTEDFA